ncbi:metabotropic glutamate receptor [Holotrichia oblita]|uniref:Metabotropic glutamate receptor n=1 Tax=Holotrichia oblita TaxID=644536 RepID=A0ACB9T633_HOLOL|nr:metabotropic glutamate receptor [Holotrichia oblita]
MPNYVINRMGVANLILSQIRHPDDPTQCIVCPQGTVPDPHHVECQNIPEEYLRPDSGWAIGAMAFSSTGILITMFVCGVFIRHNDTPVVRASGRELSYVLLAGIFMCYSVTYALVLKPNDIVCGIQRPPSGDVNTFLAVFSTIMESVIRKGKYNVVITGDFNINFQNKDQTNTKNLQDLLDSFSLKATIHEPTRVTMRSSTTVDNILTNHLDYKSDVIVSGLSDHFAQIISIPEGIPEVPRPKYGQKRTVNAGRLDLLMEKLSMIEWNFIKNESNPNICYQKFTYVLTKAIDESCPRRIFKNCRQNSRTKWITAEIKQKCNMKRLLYEDMLNNYIIKNDCSRFCKDLCNEVRTQKQRYYSIKSKATWELVSKITGSKKRKCYSVNDIETVRVLINVVWMIISPAIAIHHYPTREDNLLVCSSYIGASYMIAFTYPIFLIVICTVYAVLTRKIPEAFNESKHIGFTMYTTCIIWLAFVPSYFGTANDFALRITSMSVTISLSASVTVVCLFSPKLYIILIRPERNIRQSMMPMRYSAISKTTGTAGSGSMMATVMVTAATCNQKQQIQKHVPPVEVEHQNGIHDRKAETKESGTQTGIPPSNSNPSIIRGSPEHLQKINNNCNVGNGPLALVSAVQINDVVV